MKHSMTAVVALVLGLGVAATVNAQTTNTANTTPNANTPAATANTNTPPADTANMPSTAPAQPAMTPSQTTAPQASMSKGPKHLRTARTRTSRDEVRQAQQQLKAAGLYRGKVDGIDGRATKTALLRFQHRNGLPVTAKLNRSTMHRLLGSSTMGVGSSMPSGSNRMTGRTHKMMPPPANAAGNAAGGNTPPSSSQTHY